MGPESRASSQPAKQGAGRPPGGFLERLAALFAGDDPERQKQRLLREMAGYLKKSRPRYYNPSQRLAEPAFARFFYEIYRAFSAAQILLKGAETSVALRTAMVDMSLGTAEKALKERLTEASIDERAKKGADPAAITAEVSRDLRGLHERFDPASVKDIDAAYNRLLVLLDLIGFDYHFMLRKFDAGLPERDFVYKPRFERVNAEHVLEELQDFLEIMPCVDPDADWNRILDILKEHRGVEVVPREAMKRTLRLIRDAQRTGILLMIARHLEGDPGWKPMTRGHREHIVAPYLDRLKAEAELTARKVAQSRSNERVAALETEVFGTAAVARLANYSEKANEAFAPKMLGGYLHVTALAYLRAFLADYLHKSVREVVDILLIKGKWINNGPSQQMSEAFHQLLKVSESIARFDGDLAEDGDTGRSMRTIAIRAERDRRALTDMRALLQRTNDQAHGMINGALTQLVALAKALKLAHEDCAKQPPQLVANWRELRAATDKDVRGLIAAVYRKIYSFVQLLQFYR